MISQMVANATIGKRDTASVFVDAPIGKFSVPAGLFVSDINYWQSYNRTEALQDE